MTTRLWILGAADPEMAAIEQLLTECGERFAIAVGADGQRVIPRTAYEAVGAIAPDGSPVDLASITHVVECSIAGAEHATVIDHHRPGDPGYGRPPEEFLPASSIGQVIAELARLGAAPKELSKSSLTSFGSEGGWVFDNPRKRGFNNPPAYVLFVAESTFESGEVISPDGRGRRASYSTSGTLVTLPANHHLLLTAAADHCLEAAYRGRCPGVDPDALMRWRAESRAAFQGRSVEAVLADITAARERLQEVTSAHCDPAYHRYILDGGVADLRGESIPELPEAAAREGIPFLASVKERDGREKVVLQAAPPALVERFMAGTLVPGLIDVYGDPARGFAGGYLAAVD